MSGWHGFGAQYFTYRSKGRFTYYGEEYIARVVAYLAPYTPFSAHILSAKLSNIARQVADPDLAEGFAGLAPTNHSTTHLDDKLISESPLADVVDFLLYNALPKDQLVPAYVIAKRLEDATPDQIRDQLTPLCQEVAILKKLIQHATASTLAKLFQAFIPFPGALLNRLEKVVIASKVLQNSQEEVNIRSIKEIFIAAAIMHTPSTTPQAYIARILLHLSAAVACRPITLSDQLIDAANQAADDYLVARFSLLKEQLAPLDLNTIDGVDLMLLSTHETLDKALLPLYYNRLLPAIKDRVQRSVALSQSELNQLVAQHLPTTSKPLQETISIALYKQISQTLQSNKERVAQRWHLFLHTGKLENYADGTALLNDVIAHLPTFSLAQDKAHVRQRLIANFTHTQLMLLVQRHSEVGKTLGDFIQGSYQLWCATQGVLSGQSSTKNLFWDSVLKTLPQASIAKDDWLVQITTEWSNLLEITPTTLLATFQLLDTTGIPEALTGSLHLLQRKYQQGIQEQAIQRGYKAPVLTKLYLLLNGNLSLFDQQYHTDMPILGKQLIQFIADQPLALSKFLAAQSNHQLVARRMVYYFSQEVATKIIACLAKDKAQFISHYLNLLSNPLQQTAIAFDHPSTWQKELYISTIYYLITKKQFEESDFVHSTLLTICYTKETIYKVITSIMATGATNQEAAKMITLLKPVIKAINKPTIDSPALGHHRLEERAVTNQKAPSSNIPEEEVRVYTKNTGLVFLWPFLYDFFKVHNLMIGNQFFCAQAAHNAVYLLQYLVTGKLKSPEWQLTLPKLLCGLSYDEVLLPYRPIDENYDAQEAIEAIEAESSKHTQAEAAMATGASIASSDMESIACNNQLLIEKVIKRWKSLTKLKAIASYQDATTEHILINYFLNRLGILTRQDGDDATQSKFWHLTLMHQDYDNENLLPPWSMTSIKLPWMQEAIVLFWIPG
ncbi:contractile injection system tape measure protein [Cardinium endosymbiont of Dermatophagoides farinae]|uniref:contractile injection system tape measure protein n=1 Tax=Cardinium endosymbiont of Dermatophagoides farinae TaxID=2597823 RepID=UPI0011843D2D|nr:contractile injection system tape measure protein [Cardinium endosymbiont of Dermatophagoides farinae]TSJ80872.1 hypothetical protein FPG78_02330 [Cardinium endosymbiont of Dermatophagoides farinae]